VDLAARFVKNTSDYYCNFEGGIDIIAALKGLVAQPGV
jgi:hypothetical protein